MVVTKIINVVERIDEKTGLPFLVVYFNYLDKVDRYTYLSQKSIEYWQKKAKINKVEIGMTIYVIRLKNSSLYKIIGFDTTGKNEINE